MMSEKLIKAWVRFIKSGLVVERYFNQDLYKYMSIQPGFIAHFDRQGFICERFRSLRSFDETLRLIKANPSLAPLLDAVTADELALARYRVAAREAAVLHTRIRCTEAYLADLQREFQWPLVSK